MALQMARRECLRGRPFCFGSSKGAKIIHSSSRISLAYPMLCSRIRKRTGTLNLHPLKLCKQALTLQLHFVRTSEFIVDHDWGRSWMAGASVETTLELWASSLREVKVRIRPLFSQKRVAGSAGQFLDGLLGNEPRKTGWMRAAAAGDPGPWRQQAILGRGRWEADALRDMVRE